jgi:conjugative transfer signal peptidase TraF
MLWATGLAAGLSAGLFLAAAWHPPHARLVWNASASAPIGLYRIAPAEHLSPGDLIAIQAPPVLARYLANRRYLPLGIPMLKHVAALTGARICRKGARVSIEGRRVALALRRDRRGRSLPVWHGCRTLQPGELFLLNPATDSMDSRYFGPIPASGLVGRAIPLLTRDEATSPLRWRGWAAAHPLPGKRSAASEPSVPGQPTLQSHPKIPAHLKG